MKIKITEYPADADNTSETLQLMVSKIAEVLNDTDSVIQRTFHFVKVNGVLHQENMSVQ